MDVKRNLFKEVIADYDYGRPHYPGELYQTVQAFSGLDASSHILEVGAGTGQATDLFAAHGHTLELLEVSDAQVAFLKNKYAANPAVSVEKSYFEDFKAQSPYDLIYSATAFHWIKCERGYPKAWEMLREGGTLAVFWNLFFVTTRQGGIFDELNEINRRFFPEEALEYKEDQVVRIKEKRIQQITVGGYFPVPEYHEFRWTDQYDTKRFAAWLNTDDRVLLLNHEDKMNYTQAVTQCVDAHGGRIEVPQLVCLYLAKKQGKLS